MKIQLVVGLVVVSLTINQIACDRLSSSSEDAFSVELDDDDDVVNDLKERFFYTTPLPQYYPPIYPPMYPPHATHSPPAYPSHSPNCNICISVVSYVINKGGNSVKSRNNSLDAACKRTAADIYLCKSFIKSYGKRLSTVIRPLSNPSTICHSIHVC